MNDLTSSEPARSRDRILGLLLRSEGPLSVRALALRLGISRNAAHQHVAALEREGLVERDTSIRTKGRPSQGYRLSSAGSATFPRQYALIARQLLEELRRHLGPDELRSALQRIGASLADSLPLERNADPDEMIRSVAGLMRQLGYASQAVDGVDGPEIEAHNCVFHDLALKNPDVCEFDLALLSTFTDSKVEHLECMARGGNACRFKFVARK